MKFSYLLAVVSNRIIALFAVLALSHIMDGHVFGSYTLMAINALLIHTLIGNWLAMAATQAIATDADGGLDHSAKFARILKVFACIVIFECLIAALITVFCVITDIGVGFSEIAATLAFALAMLAFDTVTAAKNALGDDANYLRFNLVRNFSGNILALAAAWAGGSAALVLSGQTIGIVLAFAFSASALHRWHSALALLSKTALEARHWIEMLTYGIIGTVALGLLVLVNSLIRNFVLAVDGPQIAGTYSLMSDIFYAPIVLLGTSYSLSKMRQLYQLANAAPADQILAYRQFIGSIGFLTIPYGVGGYLVAPHIAAMIAPTGMKMTAISIAGLCAAQSAVLTLVFTCVTITLTGGKKKKTLTLVISTLLCILSACVAGSMLGGHTQFASMTMFASIIAAIISVAIVGPEIFPWSSLSRTALASGAMACAVLLLIREGSLVSLVIAIAAGIAVFSASAFLLRISDWRELIPART